MTHPNGPQPPDGRPAWADGAGADGPDLSAVPTFLRDRAEPAGGRAPAASRGTARTPRRRDLVAPSPPTDTIDPASLPMAGISPRRVLQFVAVIALAWGIISFGRQVASASAASAHESELRAANAALQQTVTAMQAELALIQEQRYIDLEARAYRLGSPNEIPFALDASAPSLAPDAPGSAATRLGAQATAPSPLDRWLQVLFGSG
jgi:cell division protein FtsB